MRLAGATFAYPDVAGDKRALLATMLDQRVMPEDTFVLSTCLRIEILVVGDERRLRDVADGLFAEPGVLSAATVRTGGDAVRHMFEVASGLRSPIVGEREILTQFRSALTHDVHRESVGGMLRKVLEAAVAAGRQVRSMLPDSPHDSMAAVAAQMVGAVDRVAVLGAGTMGRAVAHGLLALPAPPHVTMVVRSPENVSIEGVDVIGMEHAPTVLAEWPAVVSATSAHGRLLPDDQVGRILEARTAPITIVDLAMPPDIEVPVTPSITHIDIDALARRSQRHVDTVDAEAFLAEAAFDVFQRLEAHRDIGPVIGRLIRSADQVVDETVDRFAGRLGGGDDRAVLRQTAHTVARTLLAGPVSLIRSSGSDTADVLARACGLPEEP
jgi:glutamyl-tRNA reductase